MAKFVFIGPRGESSSACDSFDGWSSALSFSLSLFLSSRCSRKIMMFPDMTTKSRIALVSRHIQSATGSEKIIALSNIYEYPTKYRVPSKCTTPCTKVYFSTSSQEDSLDPPERDFWSLETDDRIVFSSILRVTRITIFSRTL